MAKDILNSDCGLAVLLQAMSKITQAQLNLLLSKCYRLDCAENEIFVEEGSLADTIYFVESGFCRNFANDESGNEHTTHFAYANEFEADYRAFLTRTNSAYNMQALEPSRLVAIPREAYDWLIENVEDGQSLVMKVMEIFLIYFATRLRDNYVLTPLGRYQAMERKFPGIYEKVPQYMIASYIGVSRVHLSRLKSQSSALRGR